MTYCCEMIHTKNAVRERVNSHLKQKAFKFAQLFEDRVFIDYSFLYFDPFLSIGWYISKIFPKPFEKHQVAAAAAFQKSSVQS